MERNVTSSLTPFGGAEGNETLIAQAQSAPPNGAGVLGSPSINISPLNGVKTEALCARHNCIDAGLLFFRQTPSAGSFLAMAAPKTSKGARHRAPSNFTTVVLA